MGCGVEVMTLIIGRRFLAVVLPIALVGGCTYLPEYVDPIDWIDSANEWVTGSMLGDEQISETGTLVVGAIPGEEDPFPSLTKVPDDRPSIRTLKQREEIANELVADRSAARYDDVPAATDPESTSPAMHPMSSPTDERPGRDIDGGEAHGAEIRSGISLIEEARENEVRKTDGRYTKLPGSLSQNEFAIPPPSVPDVPPWSSVEDSFDDMFRASGGAGSLTSVRGSTVFPGESMSVSTSEAGLSRVHAGVIYFGHGSTTLSKEDKNIIREIAVAVIQSGGHVSVVGHASSRTKTNDVLKHNVVNYEMSLARAESVAAELILQDVSRNRVSVHAMADDQPDYSEATKLGEAANRRANVYVDF
jgi:flagellar motor protein MotB